MFRFLRGVLIAASLGAGLAASEPAAFDPREFRDRWVRCTHEGDASGVRALLRSDAKLRFESDGRSREVSPSEYASLLRAAVGSLKRFERQRGEIEENEDGKPRLIFTVIDRIETSEGWVLDCLSREEFDFAPGDFTRAVAYRSKALTCEAVTKPEPWMNYGGPTGLNGFLIGAHFTAAPKGMALVVVGAIVAIGLLLKTLHSLGIKRRF